MTELFFLWQLEQPWQVPPHPRIGGGGYPVWLTGRAGPSHFSIIPRPPYHPKYDPIEYKICKVIEIKKLWLKKDEQWDMNQLKQEILIAAIQIKTFDSTFVHCVYVWN